MRAETVLIEASPGEVRGALMRDGAVWDVVHHRTSTPSRIGAEYRGRVRRIEPGINGAFVDIGVGADAFLRARDVAPADDKGKRRARIAEIVHEGEGIDVRVVADAFADKGPRVVRIEPAGGTGDGPGERKPPEGPVGQILERFASDRLVRIICNDAGVENAVYAWLDANMSDADLTIERGRGSLFTERGVEDAIEAALARRIVIPGGAELVFDQAEALCVIDVNSGADSGKAGRAARDVNMKAMGEIARQIRLRNIAGAIVIDALKMGARDDRSKVLDRMRGAVRDDPGGVHVLGVTNLGLIEMTRTRTGPTLAERLLAAPAEPTLSPETVACDALRAAIRTAAKTPAGGYRLLVAGPVADCLEGPMSGALAEAARRTGRLDIVREAGRDMARFEVVLGSAQRTSSSPKAT